MKSKFLILILLFAMFSPTLAQKNYVVIHNSSRLHVNGSSNINEFDCVYYFDNELEKSYSYKVKNDTDNTKLKIESIKLSIPTTQLDCGNLLLNHDFRKTLKAKSYPNINLSIPELILVYNTNQYNGSVRAIFDIAGVKKYRLIHYSSSFSIIENTYKLVGTIKVNIEDFDIEVSNKFFGSVKVNREVEISFLLNFVPN